MNLLPVLLLTLTTTTLVLQSGDRITVDDTVKEEKGRVTFRVAGTLYSLPAEEVARIEKGDQPPSPQPLSPNPVKLRVSDEDRKRLLAELEQNHAGGPAAALPAIELPPAPPKNENEEWSWRRQAQSHEEAIRRAKEELEMLETRARELQSKILTLINLGFKPRSFTYDSSQLTYTLEQIPRAQLEVQRAERAFEQFREEARRRGILPGWLR